MYYKVDYPESLFGDVLDQYLEKGWYRMQDSIYDCTHLVDYQTLCLQKIRRIRIPVEELRPHRSHKRIKRLNKVFRVEYEDAYQIRVEDINLYLTYYASIDFEGYHGIEQALYGEGRRGIYDSRCFRIYAGEELIALGIFDVGKEAAASIIHFYDPAYHHFSLGKYLMLLTVDLMKSLGMKYYYPGYVVAGRPKFDYKLFLGKESVYFLDDEEGWIPFRDEILLPDNNNNLMDVIRYILITRDAYGYDGLNEEENTDLSDEVDAS